ncbi:MAG: hypothetical protein K5798_02880 [Nitrosopumilus sp.]|uniref:hypothetical protein n=1 Tax=Nitrosopumilus sp. TaxID=2024843 RepID=UPI00242E0E10|nr:hypothetical protein [Nitrosopumilus sp.]MCV0366195.1 hypothetical protein [Nitrosopumilus sp.]
MKNILLIFLAIIGIAGFTVLVPESNAQLYLDVESLPENEKQLLEQDYYVEPYSLSPFGNKHFFFKTEKPPYISETTFNSCVMTVTFLPKENAPMHITMKFPNDLLWPGMYDNSTFYSIKNEFHQTTDEHGNMITKNPVMEWELVEPVRDSEFTTLDFVLKGEVSHFMANMTYHPQNPDASPAKPCPHVLPPMKSDYYDVISPKDSQKLIAEMWGYPPDTYICPNNLVGAIKSTDDSEVCVKPESKAKLVERGWARDFTNYRVENGN